MPGNYSCLHHAATRFYTDMFSRAHLVSLLPLAAAMTLLTVLHPQLQVARAPLLVCILLVAVAIPVAVIKFRKDLVIPELLAAIPLACLLASDARHVSSSFLYGMPRTWCLMAAGALLLTLVRFGAKMIWVPVLLTPVAGLTGLLLETNGGLLFSDDLPVFMYRFMQLKESFPSIPFYNPLWNAGADAREFFPSGSLGPFLLLAPLWYVASPEKVFTFAVAGLLFLIFPLFVFLSARRLGLDPLAQAIACVFGVTFNFFWYRFTLTYGTLGFAVSTAVLPLAVATTARVLTSTRTTVRELVVWMIALSLCVFWPLMPIVLFPLGVLFALRSPILWRTNRRVFAAVFMLALIHLPWVALFVHASRVFSFVASPDSGAARNLSHTVVYSKLREISQGFNPLILFLAPFSLGRFRQVPGGSVVLTCGLWTLSIGVFGPFFAPHLELERFLLPAGLLLSLPAAVGAAGVLRSVTEARGIGQKATTSAAALLVTVVLVFSPYWIYRIGRNKTPQRFSVATPAVTDLADAIKREAGSGRTMFAGFTLHELSDGHVAPLAAMTGKPLIASRYQHDRWAYIDVVPEEYRKEGEAGILRYLDLHNVSLVITHDRGWRKWYGSRPTLFREIAKFERFRIFKRLAPELGYFLSGSGEILAQTGNSVRLRLDSEDAVIKFTYFPWLSAGECTVLPERVSTSVTFVRLSRCPLGNPVTLRSLNPLGRLLTRGPA